MTKIEITVNETEVSLRGKGENGKINLGELLLAAGAFAANTAEKIAERTETTEMAAMHDIFEVAMEQLGKGLKE